MAACPQSWASGGERTHWASCAPVRGVWWGPKSAVNGFLGLRRVAVAVSTRHDQLAARGDVQQLVAGEIRTWCPHVPISVSQIPQEHGPNGLDVQLGWLFVAMVAGGPDDLRSCTTLPLH